MISSTKKRWSLTTFGTDETLCGRICQSGIKFYYCLQKRAVQEKSHKSNWWQSIYLLSHQPGFYPSAGCSLLSLWALSCQSSRACSGPQASPEFAPGCPDLLSAAPACNNPHPPQQSHSWGLRATRGVPAEPGGLGLWGAVLSWPQGEVGGYLQLRVPMESPEEPAAAARLRPIKMLPFLCLLTPNTESSKSSQSAPSPWRKQRSQRVHGRLSLGKMQWGRERWGKRQGDRWHSFLI